MPLFPDTKLQLRFAFIGLGSNMGDSPRIVAQAMERLQDLSDEPVRKSSLWRSDPVDCPPGSPSFVNAVVGLLPLADHSPEQMLEVLQRLEREYGRTPKRITNQPRSLDLDLISFGSVALASSVLTLPHPRAHLRRFVLAPLAEIAPDLLLPGQSKTVRQLLQELGCGQPAIRLA